MRSFSDVGSALGLRKFLESPPIGTLYFTPFRPGSPDIMVRHFDNDLPPARAADYADLINAVADWVEQRPELGVEVVRPIEVGTDFVARPFHEYDISTDTYAHPEDGVESPPEFDRMRVAVRAALAEPGGSQVIARVMAASLLEPTGRTYFNYRTERFIIVEPKISIADIQQWNTN